MATQIMVGNLASADKIFRKLDPDGTELWSRTTAGGNVYPLQVAADMDGNGYYCTFFGLVEKLNSSDGSLAWSFDTGALITNTGIAVDEPGNVYISHDVTGGKTHRKLNSSGTEQWSYDSGISTAQGNRRISVSLDGSAIYLTHNLTSGTNYGLTKLNSSGSEVWRVTLPNNGYCCAVSNQADFVYVGYDGGFRKLTSAGSEVWSVSIGDIVRGISVDLVGNVYVAYERVSSKTHAKYTSSGSETWSFDAGADGRDIVAGADGNVYIAHNKSSSKTHRKLNSSGTEVWSFDGSNGSALGDGTSINVNNPEVEVSIGDGTATGDSTATTIDTSYTDGSSAGDSTASTIEVSGSESAVLSDALSLLAGFPVTDGVSLSDTPSFSAEIATVNDGVSTGVSVASTIAAALSDGSISTDATLITFDYTVIDGASLGDVLSNLLWETFSTDGVNLSDRGVYNFVKHGHTRSAKLSWRETTADVFSWKRRGSQSGPWRDYTGP